MSGEKGLTYSDKNQLTQDEEPAFIRGLFLYVGKGLRWYYVLCADLHFSKNYFTMYFVMRGS